MSTKVKRVPYTIESIAMEVLSAMRKDQEYLDAQAICRPEYEVTHGRFETVNAVSFDALGTVTFGGNEGIYGIVMFDGIMDTHTNKRRRIAAVTIKTLSQTKEAYMAMGQMVNLICYNIMQYLEQNIDQICD